MPSATVLTSDQDDAFHQLWGTAGVAPAPDETATRVLDTDAFDRMWLSTSAFANDGLCDPD
jgi:hypothetical protein